jgi:hypothetical protein
MAWADRPPLEQVALAYCAPRGIPLSVFLGRTVYPGDPAWLEDDTLAALDWDAWERAKCPGCGQPRDESMAHEDDAPAYEVEVLRCHACSAAAAESRAAGGDSPGLFPLIRKAG